MSIKGQVLLITVFTLTFALFSIYMLLAPIKDKILRIKEMEDVYQAICNSEEGLEKVLLAAFTGYRLGLNSSEPSSADPTCAGLNPKGEKTGTCNKSIYRSDGKFQVDAFTFIETFIEKETGKEIVKSITLKAISDGKSGRAIRTIYIGPASTISR
jgi:hypothetical protein